ncbi:unnamed protein product [Phytomonas sp. EM1]|nr:unnamed protein product [Phytomonas sp. EM1]|eukprot:CCW63590.1 unnamed protein product [Phytomonas sp. isolate EM1]
MVLTELTDPKGSSSNISNADCGGSGCSSHLYNYIVERAAPSKLCQMRHVQPRPYTPLYPDIIARVTQSNDYTLRPPPYVVQQTLMEFYRVCNGHYGIHCEIPSSMELLTMQGYHYNASQSSGGSLQGVAAASSSPPSLSVFTRASTSAMPNRLVVTAKDGKRDTNDEEAIKANDFTKVLDDYRITQLRRNAQHQDTYNGRRLCMYFNTREGCRRGPYCEFLHVDKNGAFAQSRRVEGDP